MAEKIIYLKMTKPWGGFNVGDVVRFGENKGRGRIEKGEGIEVAKQKAVNDPAPVRRSPKIETADAPPPAEKAVVTPEIDDNAKAKAEAEAKSKAETEAKAKAKAEAEAKAKGKDKAKK